MNPEESFTDQALERALMEIRDEVPDEAAIAAAQARAWPVVAAALEAAGPQAVEHIRGCADFQKLMPDFRARRLPEARALLMQDHLRECVACRHVFEGRVTVMPERPTVRRVRVSLPWAAAAAAVVATAGVAIWISQDRLAQGPRRAIVQSVNGMLFAVTSAGIQPLAAGQDLPQGVELRTARDSDAMLELRDGSKVELRERSSVSTYASGNDLTVRLLRGGAIVEAAKRRQGHLYVDTADCRVAVTGTVFGVTAGLKGSRVSVIQGEVHVTEGAHETVLRPGQQAVTSETLEPESVREDIGWSRNRDRLLSELQGLGAQLREIRLPELRYDSVLLDRLPADTKMFASIPNLAAYLAEAQSVIGQRLAESPELNAWWQGHNGSVSQVLDKVRAASEYLGGEIVVVAASADGRQQAPVFFAELKRDGFKEFLRAQGLPLTVEARNGFVAFGPDKEEVEKLAPALDQPEGGFAGTPFYARLRQAYRGGAGLLLAVDLSGTGHGGDWGGARYFVAEQKEVNHQSEDRASLGFDGKRTGVAGWLAAPAPMGSLEYISPDAGALAAFVVQSPAAVVSHLLPQSAAGDGAAQTDLAASLGGEFALALDGPVLPVPAWKLVAEVYDANRAEAGIEALTARYNHQAAAAGGAQIVAAQRTVGGNLYYSLNLIAAGGRPNPLTEAHYTFSGGYLIAAPNEALVRQALEIKTSGVSLAQAGKFLAMAPRDHFANFSAVLYEDLGQSLAPLASLFAPAGAAQKLGNLKPALVAAYGEPDGITVAGSSDLFGGTLSDLLTGNVAGLAGHAVPLGHLFGEMAGTGARHNAYH